MFQMQPLENLQRYGAHICGFVLYFYGAVKDHSGVCLHPHVMT